MLIQQYLVILNEVYLICRNVKSLVILMVDLLDFPCSIWPGIVDIIGTDRPIIIVGNKVNKLFIYELCYVFNLMEIADSEASLYYCSNINIKYA